MLPLNFFYFSIGLFEGSDLDLIYEYTGNEKNVCGKKDTHTKAMYIDARVHSDYPNKMIPWDETEDELSKVSPVYVPVLIMLREQEMITVHHFSF